MGAEVGALEDTRLHLTGIAPNVRPVRRLAAESAQGTAVAGGFVGHDPILARPRGGRQSKSSGEEGGAGRPGSPLRFVPSRSRRPAGMPGKQKTPAVARRGLLILSPPGIYFFVWWTR
jgi:hypothetical protein